jgi:phage tail-like protein
METSNSTNRTSSYLQYLPAILQADPFIGRFLLAFERILSGLSPAEPNDPLPQQAGLEQVIDRIATYFDPRPARAGESSETLKLQRSPEGFLPWLASWVALSLRDDWEEEVKRRFISQMVPLYRLRGTKAGLKTLLELYTGEEVEIQEFTHLAHYFQVQMTLSASDRTLLRRKQQIARSILDQEKPAHTYYALQILIPTMQIRNDPSVGLILGVNTVLGTSRNRNEGL